MGASSSKSKSRLSCGHRQKPRKTKLYEHKAKNLKDQIEVAFNLRDYALNELSDGLKKVGVLKIMYKYIHETLKDQKGRFKEVSEALHNLNRLIDTENEIKNIRVEMKSEKSECANHLKILARGDICRDCFDSMKWRPESYSRSWNGRQHEYYPLKGLREKTNEYLETISELEDKISNDSYRVSFPKSLLKDFDNCVLKLNKVDFE